MIGEKMNTDNIKKRLKVIGKNQSWLAKKMYIQPTTLCWKLKVGRFSCDELEEIAKFLNIDNPWEFFFGDKNNEVSIPITQESVDTFGERLNQKIKEVYGTINEFSKASGITRQSIMLYIKNKRNPNITILAEMCKGLNVSADYLLFGEEKE